MVVRMLQRPPVWLADGEARVVGLRGGEAVVVSLTGQQFGVGAAFDDGAVRDDENLVGQADGGEAMRDNEGGATLHQGSGAGLDEGFGF